MGKIDCLLYNAWAGEKILGSEINYFSTLLYILHAVHPPIHLTTPVNSGVCVYLALDSLDILSSGQLNAVADHINRRNII